MSTEQTVFLIDGSAYIYRAYHAIRGLSNSKGFPTNAVFGFTRILIKLIEDHQPRFAAMVFDAKGPTFRHEMYADYKANRPPMPDDLVCQLPYIKEITKGFNLPTIEMQGYEADDLIGTLSRKAAAAGFKVIMVSGDKDLKQLITDNVSLWDPMKDVVTDAETIRTAMGIEPHQLIDVMGLSGDASDNVPGVPGIGPKTALALVQSFGDMAHLYQQVDTITKKKQRENLIQFREQALLSRDLVTIDVNAPISFELDRLKLTGPDNKLLGELYTTLEFTQLKRSVVEKADLKQKNYTALLEMEQLERLCRRLKEKGRFAVDTETTSKDPMQAELVGLSFALNPDEAFYIPCGHDYPGMPRQLEWETVRAVLKPILENPEIEKIGQNIKYDWLVLLRHGIHLAGVVFDTMLASYLINPGRRAHGLDAIAQDYIGHKMISFEEVTGKGKAAKNFREVTLDQATPYACEDADVTLAMFHILKEKLNEIGLMDLFEKIEMPLVPVLVRMEQTGICIDTQRLQALSTLFADQLQQLEESIYELAGEHFNIKSSQQLGHILFEKLQLPVAKKTKKKTGYSTDVEVLTQLAEKHALPALILRHRTLAKLKSTYSDALPTMIHPQTGRIHTSYNQTVTATGRLSSSDPNLQNIPIRDEEGRQIRRAFIPRKDWVMIAADYSQIELRILAHCSADPILIKAFEADEDIHTRTACEVFEVFPDMVTSDLRRHAKVINFGIIYGMSAFGLSKALSISQKMAKNYIDGYFKRYQGVKNFIDRTVETARKERIAKTLAGRIRQLPDIDSRNWTTRQFAERMAFNTTIQGTAADLIKIAMINVNKALQDFGDDAAMMLSVHDELVFETPTANAPAVMAVVKEVMENVWALTVPLKVNLASAGNWADAH